MLELDGEQKRRPPPVLVPPRSWLSTSSSNHSTANSRTSGTHREGQQQRQHVPSAASLPNTRPSPVTPPLTSYSDQDYSRLSRAGSEKSGRIPGLSKLADLMEESSARPRSSSDMTMAQSPATGVNRDEKSVRGKIESQKEQSLHNMASRALPANSSTTSANKDVEIEVHDFRRKSQTASEEVPMKSPRKKFLGVHMPEFSLPPALKHSASRKFGNAKKPTMPQKFAEIVGEKPRGFRQVPVRPIKPSGYNSSPTKAYAPRSETSISLPAKVADQDQYARRHHANTTRRSRGGIRRSPPRKSPQPASPQARPSKFELSSSVDSTSPPTPPAKDTPPDIKSVALPGSPLRRSAPSIRLRESYALLQDPTHDLRFPAFALSPSLRSASPVRSPMKLVPATVEDYQRLLAGLPQPFPSDVASVASESQVRDVGSNGAFDSETVVETTATIRADDSKKDMAAEPTPSTERTMINEQTVGEDETVLESLYYIPPPGTFQRHLQERSTSLHTHCRQTSTTEFVALSLRTSSGSLNGNINMTFQGDAQDIDPGSSTAQLVKNRETNKPEMRAPLEPSQRARMQELRFGEQEPQLQANGAPRLLQPEHSSSRLTDMLNGVSPHRHGFNGDFNNPSAVPSPLHKHPESAVQQTPSVVHRSPIGAWPPSTPQTIDHQFHRVNEHLDVVGKSTWDMIETMKQQQHAIISEKNKQVVSLMEHYIGEVKMQLDSVNDKTDRATEQGHNIHTKLDKLFEFVEQDVVGKMAAQEKRAESLEQNVQELRQMVQKLLEQKTPMQNTDQSASQAAQFPTPTPAPPGFSLPVHRSQPSLTNYYGSPLDLSREAPPPMPHMDQRDISLSNDVRNDSRLSYGGGYGHQWGPRGYHVRNSKDERQYTGSSPFHFTNGNGHFNNGYGGGYSSYNYTPTTPEHH